MNGTPSHVHLLISVGKSVDIPELIGDIKRDSSNWMKTKGFKKFYWQKGYGVFSIGQSQVPAVLKYIENQKGHHENVNFKDEFRVLLKRYEIDYDERYVWD